MTRSQFQSLQTQLAALRAKYARDYRGTATHAELKQEQFEILQLENEIARSRSYVSD